MKFMQLLCAKVDNETVYFDGNGLLYEKYPLRSFVVPTNRYVYLEYFEKPLFMLSPCNALIWADEYDFECKIVNEDDDGPSVSEKNKTD